MNEVFSFRNIPKEPKGKEGQGNGGQNKLEAALTEAKDKFNKTKQGRFLSLIGRDPESQSDALFSIGIIGNKSEGFIKSLKREGLVEVEESGDRLLVTKINTETVERKLEEKLYDRELLRFIKAEENQGMSLAMIAFYIGKSKGVTDKKIKNLKDLGFIVEAMPVVKPIRYYFSPDFVIEGEPERTTKKMAIEVGKREKEFEEKRQPTENKI